MPEGDTVANLAHRLHAAMANHELTSTDFRIPELATLSLAGWTVSDVIPRAKYLLMMCGPVERIDPSAARRVILSHLGMEGSWKTDARITGQTRCILSFAWGRVLGTSLALLKVPTLQQAHDQLAFLGPDLLDPQWEDPGHAKDLMGQALLNIRQAPDQPMATALLDQRLVSGLGNIYRCELLLLARINPHRRLSELSD